MKMDVESKKFLSDLLSQCGPSGFEQEIQKAWVARTKKYADNVEKDIHGNAIAVLNSKADFRIMLAGHCDEIGFVVNHISKDGFLYFSAIGGIDAGVVPGTQLKIQSTQGKWIDGIIGKKAIHMMTVDERAKLTTLERLYIDIGAKSKTDALKYVKIGSAVAVSPNMIELQNGLFSSKACDDRVGAFVVSEVLKILSKNKKLLKIGVYSVSTVQEEVGLRGAITSSKTVRPNAAIAVDVGHATDTPDVDRRIEGETFLNKGPIISFGPQTNPVMGSLLESIAKRKKIPYQVRALNSPYGTDTAMLQIAREGGVATALIGIPNRYMHTAVETCSFDDVINTAKLIANTILSIKPNMSFIPE